MWLNLLISLVASVIVSYAIRKKLRTQKQKPGELEFPTAEQGRPIPVVFGTKEVKAPNVVWVGDRKNVAYVSQGGGIFYYAGMHMVICHGVCDYLREIYSDGRVVDTDIPLNSGLFASAEIEAFSPLLFGGKSSEGGITGLIDVLFGEPTQAQNAYLQSKITTDIPAFRGVMSVVLKQCYLGNSQYIRPWSFLVQRIHKTYDDSTQWYDAKAQVNTTYQLAVADIAKPATETTADVINSLSHLQTYIIKKPAGLTYQAWSPDGGTTWKNEFNVYVGSTLFAPDTYWSGTYASAALAEAAFANEIIVVNKGFSAANIYIDITEASGSRANNTGGLSLEIYSTHQNDMNPVHIIRELLTDPVYGMGADTSEIDSVSFEAAADICYSEGMGLSLVMETRGSIEEAIADVLDHCGGMLYTDISTGKFKLKMIRDDYDIGTLLTLDETNIIRVDKASRPTFSELVNSITVNYYDYKARAIKTTTAQDHALVSAMGAVVDEKIEYLSFSNGEIAARAALRDLRALSTPLLNASISCTREAAVLAPGDVFILDIDQFSNVVMRVQKITYGTSTDNTVKIDAVEDVFNMDSFGVVVEQIEPDYVVPEDVADYFVEESPYHLMAEAYGQSTANAWLAGTPTMGMVSVSAVNPASCNEAVITEDGVDTAVASFCPVAYLDGDITAISDTTFAITNWSLDITEVATGSICYCSGEFLRVDGINTGTGVLTVGRGCLDTYPKLHSDGDAVLFLGEDYTVTQTQYVSADTPDVKLLTTTAGAVLAAADATTHTVTMVGRAARPYPVADLQVDGDAEPDPAAPQTYPVDVTWSARNRLRNIGSAILDWFDAAETAEVGTTYDVLFEGLDINMTLLGTILSDNTSASTYALTSADITGSSYPDAQYIRATVTAVRSSLDSWESPYIVFRGVFEIATLFGGGEDGAWYDPSDLSTLWQNVGGTTPVTAVGQTVAKMDDKSGNGNHAFPTSAILSETTSGYKYIEYTGSTGALGVTFGASLGADCSFVLASPEKIGSTVYQEGVTIGATPLVKRNHGEIVIVDRALTDGEYSALHSVVNYPEMFAEWPETQDITDAASLWEETATATATTGAMGATITGPSYPIAAPNGLLYCTPSTESDVIVIDPMAETTSTMGASLGATANKWIGGALAPNGKIYCAPFTDTNVLIIDTVAGTTSTTNFGLTISGGGQWYGAIYSPFSERIYCIPHTATEILIIDPSAGTAIKSAMGATLTGSQKWSGGTLAPNGKIYCTPRDSTDILIIDTVNGTATRSAMGATLTGTTKWQGSAIGGNGLIYCAPYSDTQILIINPTAGTASKSAMSATLSDSNKFTGAVLGNDGKIYCAPRDATDILIITPGGTATRSALGATLTGSTKYTFGCLSANGKIFFGASTKTDFLQIQTYGTGGGQELSPYLNKL